MKTNIKFQKLTILLTTFTLLSMSLFSQQQYIIRGTAVMCPNPHTHNFYYAVRADNWDHVRDTLIWTVENGVFFDNNSTTITMLNGDPVDVRWNSVQADTNNQIPRGRLTARHHRNNQMQGSLDVVIKSVRGWRPDVRIGSGANNADHIIPYNTMATVQVSATEFFPNTSGYDGVGISQYEWTLPDGMSSQFGQGTFLAGNTIDITPTSPCVSINGVLRVRARNLNCGLGNEHNGAFRDIVIRRSRPVPTLTASRQAVYWYGRTEVRFTASGIPPASSFIWVVSGDFERVSDTIRTYVPELRLYHNGRSVGAVSVRAVYCGDIESGASGVLRINFDPNTIPTILGPSTVCDPSTYRLSRPDLVANWSLPKNSDFEFTSPHENVNSVEIRTTRPDSQTTLTVTVHGVVIEQPIRSCHIFISGQATICDTATFELSNRNFRADWSFPPNSGFEIISPHEYGYYVRVRGSRFDSQAVLTATINGVSISRTVRMCTPAISGPTAVCPGTVSVEFSIPNLPEGATVQWSHGHSLHIWEVGHRALVSNQIPFLLNPDPLRFPIELYPPVLGPPIHYPNPIFRDHNSWIRAYITFNGHTTTLVQNLVVNRIQINSIVVPKAAGSWYSPGVWGFSATHGHSGHLNWAVTPAHNTWVRRISYFDVEINFPYIGRYTVSAFITNACGTTLREAPFSIHLPDDPPIQHPPILVCRHCFGAGCIRCMTVGVFSPNPVSDILTIDLTQTDTDAFGIQPFSEMIFDIRLLNSHGMIVRQQRTQASSIQFDVSNLPEGTYYLHIEHNGEIEMHQIIVQRN